MGVPQQILELRRQILALKTRLGQVVITGTTNPAAHAATHADAGSDPVNVTTLDGFPGGTTTFLRADGTFASAGGSYTDEQAQDAIGGMVDTTLEYVDATPLLRRAALTGDATASAGSNAVTIPNNTVTPAKMDDGAAVSVLGRSANSSGDRADIPASADGQVLRRSSGSVGFGAVDLADSDAVTGLLPLANIAARTGSLGITVDGAGSTITTGIKGYIRIPFACTLTAWTILANQSGAIKFDVWKDVFANYPPDNGDSITNGHEPEITASGTNAEDTNISDWTSVAVTAGDVIGFNVDSVTSIQRATLHISISVP